MYYNLHSWNIMQSPASFDLCPKICTIALVHVKKQERKNSRAKYASIFNVMIFFRALHIYIYICKFEFFKGTNSLWAWTIPQQALHLSKYFLRRVKFFFHSCEPATYVTAGISQRDREGQKKHSPCQTKPNMPPSKSTVAGIPLRRTATTEQSWSELCLCCPGNGVWRMNFLIRLNF